MTEAWCIRRTWRESAVSQLSLGSFSVSGFRLHENSACIWHSQRVIKTRKTTLASGFAVRSLQKAPPISPVISIVTC